MAIHTSTAYVFKNAQHGADLFSFNADGYTYARGGNPTSSVLNRRMAKLENGSNAFSCASGQSALFMAIAGLVQAGDNILVSKFLYGGTYNLFKIRFKRLGNIEPRFIDPDDSVEAIEKLIDEKTKALFVESIANPRCHIPDFEKLSKISRDHGVPFVVDNTLGAGGYVLRPIDYGANIVVHSATKWINGHGTGLGGIIIDACNFPYQDFPEKFGHLVKSGGESYHGINFYEKFKEDCYTAHIATEIYRDIGPTLNSFSAFLLLQGLETLSLRLDRECENAMQLAQYLESNPHIAWISYPGLISHPCHKRAKKYLREDKFGAVVSFGLAPINGKDPSFEFMDRLKLVSQLANLGDSKSLIIHPYSTLNEQLSEQERIDGGCTPDLIRVSVGTEFIDDIIDDFKQAFENLGKAQG